MTITQVRQAVTELADWWREDVKESRKKIEAMENAAAERTKSANETMES